MRQFTEQLGDQVSLTDNWKAVVAAYPLQLIDRAIQLGWVLVYVHGIDCVHHVGIVALTTVDNSITNIQQSTQYAATTLQYGFVANALIKLFSFF